MHAGSATNASPRMPCPEWRVQIDACPVTDQVLKLLDVLCAEWRVHLGARLAQPWHLHSARTRLSRVPPWPSRRQSPRTLRGCPSNYCTTSSHQAQPSPYPQCLRSPEGGGAAATPPCLAGVFTNAHADSGALQPPCPWTVPWMA
eukprot:11228310-Lingulodinium_polyedra.AAC.1